MLQTGTQGLTLTIYVHNDAHIFKLTAALQHYFLTETAGRLVTHSLELGAHDESVSLKLQLYWRQPTFLFSSKKYKFSEGDPSSVLSSDAADLPKRGLVELHLNANRVSNVF